MPVTTLCVTMRPNNRDLGLHGRVGLLTHVGYPILPFVLIRTAWPMMLLIWIF